MAIIHQATLTPSKLELISGHLAGVPSLASAVGGLAHLGAYRFDDPAGHVGIETHILQGDDGTIVHLPLTYRNDPFEEAEDWFVGTMEHSVLGTRWVYDGCGDSVYVEELLRTIVTAGAEVPEIVETPHGPVPRDPSARVTGSGAEIDMPPSHTHVATVVGTETHVAISGASSNSLVVLNVLDVDAQVDAPQLTGVWEGQIDPVLLAYLA